MATFATRLHRLGTIYTRTRNSLDSGIMKHEDRPIWFDVYEAFPPIRDPYYIRDKDPDKFGLMPQDFKVQEIFYAEDWVRAMIKKNKVHEMDPFNTCSNTINLLPSSRKGKPTFSRLFIDSFKKLEKENEERDQQEIFQMTIERLSEELKKAIELPPIQQDSPTVQ